MLWPICWIQRGKNINSRLTRPHGQHAVFSLNWNNEREPLSGPVIVDLRASLSIISSPAFSLLPPAGPHSQMN